MLRVVIPAHAGIQEKGAKLVFKLDPRVRGDDNSLFFNQISVFANNVSIEKIYADQN